MDRRDEETQVWPSARSDPPAGDGLPPEAPRSLWARLWDFFTEEVPDEPDPEGPEIRSQHVRAARGEDPAPARDAPGSGPTTQATMPVANVWRRAASPDRPLSGRGRRHSRLQPPRRRRARRRRWAAGAVALAGVAAAALLVAHAGHPHLRTTAGQVARPATHAPVQPGQAAPVTAPAAQAAPAAPARPASAAQAAPAPTAPAAPASADYAKAHSAPDCASMHMQPVMSPGASTSPSVPGLCFSLGGGSGWLIGCAPGSQAACDPSLQRVIACVRQDGARHHGVVTDANVRACDVSAADASRPAGGGAPAGPAPPA